MSELGALELDTELALLLSEDSALLEALAGVELLTIELLESELSPSELLLERLLETELWCADVAVGAARAAAGAEQEDQ